MTSRDSNVPSTHARRNATFKFKGTDVLGFFCPDNNWLLKHTRDVYTAHT